MSEWISVREQLPDEGVPVWATDGSHIRMLCVDWTTHPDKDELCWLWSDVSYVPYRHDGKWKCDAELDDDYSEYDRWMPLPEPPK